MPNAALPVQPRLGRRAPRRHDDQPLRRAPLLAVALQLDGEVVVAERRRDGQLERRRGAPARRGSRRCHDCSMPSSVRSVSVQRTSCTCQRRHAHAHAAQRAAPLAHHAHRRDPLPPRLPARGARSASRARSSVARVDPHRREQALARRVGRDALLSAALVQVRRRDAEPVGERGGASDDRSATDGSDISTRRPRSRRAARAAPPARGRARAPRAAGA